LRVGVSRAALSRGVGMCSSFFIKGKCILAKLSYAFNLRRISKKGRLKEYYA